MRAWGSPSPAPLDSSEILLSIPTIRSLLSVKNLRVLVLDLFVGFLKVPGEQGDGCHHICPAIGALLHKLETLHLRMRSICPDALKPCGPSGGGSLSLSRVAINLSLIPSLPGITSAAHSKRCGSRGGGGGRTDKRRYRGAGRSACKSNDFFQDREDPDPLTSTARNTILGCIDR